MELEDALTEVLAAHDALIEQTGKGSSAGNVLRDYFRQREGFQFEGDDVLGTMTPAPGDKCVFLPLADRPPADRPPVQGPIAGCIEQALSVTDCHPHPGFPFYVRLDDARDPAKATRLWAERDEVHITMRAKTGAS